MPSRNVTGSSTQNGSSSKSSAGGGGRAIAINNSLGKDKLQLQRFTVSEQLGRPFRIEAELLSKDPDIVFDKLVGDTVCISVELGDDKYRYFHGRVASFCQANPVGGYACYRATIVPWVWLLTRTADCRIFQGKTIPDIIKAVFREYGFSDFKDDLKGTYQPWIYCVQYRESDFNFVSRLMEQEGIYYYWKHTESSHELVLCDDSTVHETFPGYEKIVFRPEHAGFSGGEDISSWTIRQELQPGIYALSDFNFQTTGASLQAKSSLSSQRQGGKWEIFDYPGEYEKQSEGESYAKVRIQELQASSEIVSGTSDVRGICVGSRFKLDRHPRKDQNREYLVTASDYTFADVQRVAGSSGDAVIHCNFNALDAEQQFRPTRSTPKPVVQGPQTAIVVGPKGEEIYVDEYGRVKVQFHWDRYGKKDQNSSCWIRVSQAWAGQQWGSIHTPRIGQEVIVEFLEGDPDQPIITGRVYNDACKPPYALPANKTQSGVKSRSSQGGNADNFNEIRFEDKKGDEELYVQAEKDRTMLVKHDNVENIGHDEMITIGHDQTETVKNNRVVKIGANHTEEVAQSMNITIGSTLTEMVAINYAETVGAAMELTVGAALAITVGAAMAETVGGAKVESVGMVKSENVGGNRSLNVGGDKNETIAKNRIVSVAKDQKTTIGGQQKIAVTKEYILNAKKVQIVADDEILLKTGSASITLKKSGDILINGKKIEIKGSGDVVIKGSQIKEN